MRQTLKAGSLLTGAAMSFRLKLGLCGRKPLLITILKGCQMCDSGSGSQLALLVPRLG